MDGGKVPKDIQQLGDPGTFQRDQQHKNPTYGPQGHGQQTPKEWGHIQV